ncbi:tyrosine-type recombinase/integrase [Sabulicella rubraurantiaca]|uniref:tyrosine-type recombinase/integrase n=1 Tax=Sabulicella rubraurantiaca TaxID=2811429 RepID=UPI001A96C150|nr:tyrosine-type recombinase/integrase [Sabulicella rubraurantiaca]
MSGPSNVPVSLPISSWPVEDRRRWEQAREGGDVFEADHQRRELSSDTWRNYEAAYGRWLATLATEEPAAMMELPEARVTAARLQCYAALETGRCTEKSAGAFLANLVYALTIVAPEADTAPLKRLAHVLRRRAPSVHDKWERLLAIDEVFKLGERLLLGAIERIDRNGRVPIKALLEGRDGAILVALSSKPLRPGALCSLQLSDTTERSDGRLRVVVRGEHDKSGQQVAHVHGPDASRLLRLYCDRVRPLLPGAAVHDAWWPSARGEPLGYLGLRGVTRQRLQAAFGRAVPPHALRHCVATAVAVVMPEQMGIATVMLDHASERTTKAYYDLARGVGASRKLSEIVRRKLR